MWPFAGILDSSGVGISTNFEMHSTNASPPNCLAGLRFNDNGYIEKITGGTPTYTVLTFDDTGYHDNSDVSTGGEVDHEGEWHTGAPAPGVGSDYEMRMISIDSGNIDGFNDFTVLNTWYSLSLNPRIATTRTGGKEGQGAGTDQATCTMEFRKVGGPLLSTFTVRMISHRLV
jgi:hypothetical protein